VIRIERTSDGSIDAIGTVVVGVETSEVRVPLGRFEHHVDPGGLRSTPVVVLTRPTLESLVRAGAERSGGASVTRVDAQAGVPLGGGLLRAAMASEIVLVTGSARAAQALTAARALGGMALPVIAFDDAAEARSMLRGCRIDLDIALPSIDEPVRGRIRAVAAELGLFADHHVVEVDPRPAFPDLLASERSEPSLHGLAAAATGVLAGRVAVEGRRWR